MEFKNSDAFKAFLKKESKRLGISSQNTYNTFFSRLLLQRISNFSDKEIIVKGSLATIVHTGKIYRPLTDLDLTSRSGHESPWSTLYTAMYDGDDNDVVYDILYSPNQTKTGIYKLKILAMYGSIEHSLNIDFKEKNRTIYEVKRRPLPKIFIGDEDFLVNVPSYEETLAQKLCIVVEKNRTDILNTRVKDFYDIYVLHGGEYDFEKFSYFFEKMLRTSEKVNIDDITTNYLNADYISKHQDLWDKMKIKYEFMENDIDFHGAVYYTKSVLAEQLQKIKSGKNQSLTLLYKPAKE